MLPTLQYSRLTDLASVNYHALNASTKEPGKYEQASPYKDDLSASTASAFFAKLQVQIACLMPQQLTLSAADSKIADTKPDTLHEMWRRRVQQYTPMETSYESYRASLDLPVLPGSKPLLGLDQLFGVRHNPLLPPLELSVLLQSEKRCGIGISYIVWVALCFYLSIRKRWLCYTPDKDNKPYNEAYPPYLFLLYCQSDFRLSDLEEQRCSLKQLSDTTDMVQLAKSESFGNFAYLVCCLVKERYSWWDVDAKLLHGYVDNMFKKNFALYLVSRHFSHFTFSNLETVHTHWVCDMEGLDNNLTRLVYYKDTKQRYPQSKFICETYTPTQSYARYLVPSVYGHLRLHPFRSILTMSRPYHPIFQHPVGSAEHLAAKLNMVLHVAELLWYLIFMVAASEHSKQYTGINKFLYSLYELVPTRIRTPEDKAREKKPKVRIAKSGKRQAMGVDHKKRPSRQAKLDATSTYFKLSDTAISALKTMSRLSKQRNFLQLDLPCARQLDPIRLRYCYCEWKGVLYWLPPWHLVDHKASPVDESSIMYLTPEKVRCMLQYRRLERYLMIKPAWPTSIQIQPDQWSADACWRLIEWPVRDVGAFRCHLLQDIPPVLQAVLPPDNWIEDGVAVVTSSAALDQQPVLINRFQRNLLRLYVASHRNDDNVALHPYQSYLQLACLLRHEADVLSTLFYSAPEMRTKDSRNIHCASFLDVLKDDYSHYIAHVIHEHHKNVEIFGDVLRDIIQERTRTWDKCSPMSFSESALYQTPLVRLMVANQPFFRLARNPEAALPDMVVNYMTSGLCYMAKAGAAAALQASSSSSSSLSIALMDTTTRKVVDWNTALIRLQENIDSCVVWPAIQATLHACPALCIKLPGSVNWQSPTAAHVTTPLQHLLAHFQASNKKMLLSAASQLKIKQSKSADVSCLSNKDVAMLHALKELVQGDADQDELESKISELYVTAVRSDRQIPEAQRLFAPSPYMMEAYQLLHTSLESLEILVPDTLFRVFQILMNEKGANVTLSVTQLFEVLLVEEPQNLARLRSSVQAYRNDHWFSLLLRKQGETDVMKRIVGNASNNTTSSSSSSSSSSASSVRGQSIPPIALTSLFPIPNYPKGLKRLHD